MNTQVSTPVPAPVAETPAKALSSVSTSPKPKPVAKTPTKTAAKPASRPMAKAAVATKRASTPLKAAVKLANKAAVKPASEATVKKVPVTQSAKTVSGKAAAAPKVEATKQASLKKMATQKEITKSTKDKAPVRRPQKVKMVRDSFTFPDVEHKRLVEMKRRLIGLGMEVKKGELVRAGLAMLAAMTDAQLLKSLAAVEKMKTGRPKK